VLTRGSGDVLNLFFRDTGRLFDIAEKTVHALDVGRGFQYLLAQRMHATGGTFRFFIDGAHHGFNIVRRALGPLRQLSYLARHHCKSTPMLTGAGRFDGSIERQQLVRAAISLMTSVMP